MESGDEPSVPRWWFNSATGSCVQFTWDPTTIEGASPNNFRTVDHCESYCRDTCKRGAVEFTKSSAVVFEEQPKSAHLCGPYGGRQYISKPILNYDRGVAIASSKSTTRYYYDVERSQCVSFVYHGLGNFNNFVTKQECEVFCSRLVCANGSPLRIGEDWQRCEASTECPSSHFCSTSHRVCCPSAQSICTQPKQPGDCTSTIRRYWYNAVTRQCEMFHYTGCHGNDNSFHSLVACQQQCKGIRGCPNGGFPLQEEKSVRPVACSGLKGCPSTHECVGIPSKGNVAHRCCPTKEHICSQPPLAGSQCSSVTTSRYYFNLVTRQCTSFHFNGCSGNLNNFATKELCNNFCSSAACELGETVLKDPGTSRPFRCNSDLRNSCPPKYQCRFSKLLTYAVCCGSPVTDHCPEGERPYMVSIDETVKECSANIPGSCPAQFLCRFNLQKNKYYCCAPDSESVCKGDAQFIVDDGTKMPRICTPGLLHSCPLGYHCQLPKPQSTNGFCCKVDVDVITDCPGKSMAFLNLDGEAKQCAKLSPSCPAGFSCQQTKHHKFLCCTIEGTSVKSAQNLTNFPATQTYLNVTKTPTVKMKPHTVGSPCNGSTVLVDGTCKKIGKQMPCFLRTQCPTGLECINFVCAKKDEKTEVLKRPACAEGSIMINGRCIHLVEVNGRCSANEQCQGGSKCHNKTCSCGSDAVLYKGVCRGKSADFD
nr:Proteinase inhibitor I2 and Nematode-specific EB region domain containing protein [Haemonchus contortus]